jgi:phage repressor protein C with HTH and peptisase S24 domain
MLTHGQIWGAIEALAAKRGMSASMLAKRSGLDPTTFNKSKRESSAGRLRWPSTESISKILESTGTPLDEFLGFVGAIAPPKKTSVPLIGLAQAGSGGFFDDAGFPVGGAWDEIDAPELAGAHVYALEISGDSMLPVYREGDIVIVNPESPVRRGDRVVVKTTEGEVLAKELKRRTAKTLELKSLNPEHEDRALPMESVDWIARILWTSQ